MNHLNIFLNCFSVFLGELITFLGDFINLIIFREYLGLLEGDITLFLPSRSFLGFLPISYLIEFFAFWIKFLILIFPHLSSSLISWPYKYLSLSFLELIFLSSLFFLSSSFSLVKLSHFSLSIHFLLQSLYLGKSNRFLIYFFLSFFSSHLYPYLCHQYYRIKLVFIFLPYFLQ